MILILDIEVRLIRIDYREPIWRVHGAETLLIDAGRCLWHRLSFPLAAARHLFYREPSVQIRFSDRTVMRCWLDSSWLFKLSRLELRSFILVIRSAWLLRWFESN